MDSHKEEPFLFTPAHGEHAVRWHGGKGFVPVEVVFKLLGVLLLVLAIHDLGLDDSIPENEFTQLGAGIGVIAESFGNDIASTGKGIDSEWHSLIFVFVLDDEFFCFCNGVGCGVFFILPDEVGQGLETSIFRHGGSGAAFRSIGSKDVLKTGDGLGVGDFLF